MKLTLRPRLATPVLSPRSLRCARALVALALTIAGASAANPPAAADTGWRPLPLVAGGKVHPDWVHIGWGGFVVEEGGLRTDCDPRGLGLLVYRRERLGNCQIRVVFKTQEAKSNAGIYVRLADGILDQIGRPGAQFERTAAGKITPASMELMQASGERDEGPWYAVHHGYEVQIMDRGDALHRTGAIYSLAPSSADQPRPGVWRTLLITLDRERITVDLDGTRVSSFDSAAAGLPPRKIWHEPKREPARPIAGYLGLQNHDPGDVVWFREVSVRPLPAR
ncbi:MAG: DUF1080 domain-containing protein [Verrucomicrobia bacterium]|nr:DUF1080 domain-containing protein [Verrucomicrobiota bacterium]